MRSKIFVIFGLCLLSFNPNARGGGHSTLMMAGPGGVGVVSAHTGRRGRPVAIGMQTVYNPIGSLDCNPNPYNPYLPYWSSYPASTYTNQSFGYWSPSNGSYGSYYTQPGQYRAYTYGPYMYSNPGWNYPMYQTSTPGFSYFTQDFGLHSGLVNFAYTRVPGHGYSLWGTNMYGSPFFYSGIGR